MNTPFMFLTSASCVRLLSLTCDALAINQTLMRCQVLDGRPDGRSKGAKHPAHKKFQLDHCTRFLQQRYHFDGESLPDKFEFDKITCKGRLLCAPGPRQHNRLTSELFDDSSEEVEGCQRDIAAWKEKDARSLAAMSLHNLVTCNPHHSVTMGPGAAAAPRRWLGVMKPALMYTVFRQWCGQNALAPVPSFTTFRRSLRLARPWIAFRKSKGQHGLCDSCSWHKQELKRKSPSCIGMCFMMLIMGLCPLDQPQPYSGTSRSSREQRQDDGATCLLLFVSTWP